jgi:choline-sulfatase
LYRVPPESKESGFRALQSGEIQLGPEDLALLDDLYTGGVTAADYLLNQILTRWTATRPTGIVAVTSDHGEYLGERGLWEHGKTVYAQVVDVPLVIAAPGRLAAGQRIGTPVQLQDVHDTLLDLAGLPDPAPASLVRVIEGTSRPGPILSKAWATRVWAERMGGRFALDWMLYRVGNEALILASDGSAQLFDVEQDRGMKVDLSADRPERTKALIEAAKGVYVEPAEAAGEPITLPKDVLEALQAVGYVGG